MARVNALSPPAPHVVVLFGAAGDLSKRKLLNGLLHLYRTGLMPDFRIVGVSNEDLDDDAFRELAAAAHREFGHSQASEAELTRFLGFLTYVNAQAGAKRVAAAVHSAQGELGVGSRILHYLSIPPAAAQAVVKTIDEARLVENSRVIMEKPFGWDLESARALNASLHEVFDEEQIYRIDHFLGKEAAQNILALRFANGLFEPIWNRTHIDHVLIEVPETLSVGTRAGFYEGTGAYRDMIVTHLFQVLAFVAMEPPTTLESRSITEEKNKVFRSLHPLTVDDVAFGQYEGYRDELGVASDSNTETFAALRCQIDNWRWAGVQFFLRTGKCMAEGARIISIAFHEPPQSMFGKDSGVGQYGPDHLTFDLDDSARLSLSFYSKRPGPTMVLDKASMQFSLDEVPHRTSGLEAYERLIRDAMTGDQTLFTTAEGIERLWEISTPVLDGEPEVHPYEPKSWGPIAALSLIEPRKWRLPFERAWRPRTGPVLGA